jgi:hypothetical protein
MMMLILLTVRTHAAPEATDASVKVSADNHHMTLTLDRSMKGGTLYVFTTEGELISSASIVRRRVRIDFRNVRYGAYKVVLMAENAQREFHFMRK